MPYPAIIIDDEALNISMLESIIEKFCPDIEVVASAANVSDGLQHIIAHKPKILFLDIELEDKTGFEILNLVKHPEMQVVLVTAFEQYTLQAFKYGVVDYLLKPIHIEELVAAVQRCINRITRVPPPPNTQFLTVPQKDGTERIPFVDIIHFDANKGYTDIYTIHNKKIVSSRTLTDTEALLTPDLFFRVHHSHIVNNMHVRKLLRGANGSLLMSNGAEIPISYANRQDVLKWLGM